VLLSKRIFYYKRKKTEEKWVYYTKEKEDAVELELLNPNKWGENDVLSFAVPTPDGKLLAFGKEKGVGEEGDALGAFSASQGNLSGHRRIVVAFGFPFFCGPDADDNFSLGGASVAEEGLKVLGIFLVSVVVGHGDEGVDDPRQPRAYFFLRHRRLCIQRQQSTTITEGAPPHP
ncbi:MAG: hypothetical protein IH888_03240, partial [Planctomycetes bacterium]|nr:hypothetical protein [Planctomycetota bacterium]